MAATRRQKSTDPAERKRGKYKADAAPPSGPTGPSRPLVVTRAQWQEWVEQFYAGSPLRHDATRRALAEALATAKRIVTEFAEKAPTTLTDGEARLLAKALKELRDTTNALHLGDKDKERERSMRPRKGHPSNPSIPTTGPRADSQAHAQDNGRPRAVARGKLDGQGRKPVEPQRPRVGAGAHAPASVRMEDLLPG